MILEAVGGSNRAKQFSIGVHPPVAVIIVNNIAYILPRLDAVSCLDVCYQGIGKRKRQDARDGPGKAVCQRSHDHADIDVEAQCCCRADKSQNVVLCISN